MPAPAPAATAPLAPTAPPADPSAGQPTSTTAAPAYTATPATTQPIGSQPATAGNTNGVSYTIRLHDLERRVNELKEQIFRSKARLNLMKETVLGGQLGGSRAIILHRNEMGSTYTLIKYVYALDGTELVAKTDESGHLGDNQEFEIYNGSIPPGNHTLSVVLVYQGNGYGVFSYLKGYKFTANSTKTFTFTEGKTTQIKVVGFENGNPLTTKPEDRPAIDFRVTIASDKPETTSATPAAAPAKK
jgi:hypothetical protein